LELKVKTAASLPEAANFPVAGIPDGNKLRPVVSAHSIFRFRLFNGPFFSLHSFKVEQIVERWQKKKSELVLH
jgi:hypothetical protein